MDGWSRSKEMWGDALFTSRDYREVLARPDVDAVIIATPDHWHARIAIDAMKAGKDVYLEKPMIKDIDEGPRIIEAAQTTKRILQVGSQRVSSIIYAKARELFKSGVIGELNFVEAWWHRNSAMGAWQYTIPPDASTETCDWDRFVGDAPKRPFDATRLFRWRNYRDYGTGIPGDLFVHLFSGIHYVLDSTGPTRVMATGGLRSWKDGRDVPDIAVGFYDYPKTATHPAFTLMLKVNFADGGGGDGHLFRFAGPDGVITIGGSGVDAGETGTRRLTQACRSAPSRGRCSSRLPRRTAPNIPSRSPCVRAKRPSSPRRPVTTTPSITSGTSSTPSAAASR